MTDIFQEGVLLEYQLRKTEASRVSASQYSASVLTVQKQHDWEHRPIINGRESGPVFCKGRRNREMKVHVNLGEFNMYKSTCEKCKKVNVLTTNSFQYTEVKHANFK